MFDITHFNYPNNPIFLHLIIQSPFQYGMFQLQKNQFNFLYIQYPIKFDLSKFHLFLIVNYTIYSFKVLLATKCELRLKI